jgi:predicted nucleotidyltransferase
MPSKTTMVLGLAMRDHGLTHQQLHIIGETLRPFADKITTVGLFGSRATGTYRDNSDIDLVLYGPLSAADIDRIYTRFEDSALPIKVDVAAFDLIDHPPLKQHIAAVMRPLEVGGGKSLDYV